MSNRDSDLQHALDNNDFITVGKQTTISSSKSFHQAYALFNLKTHDNGPLPNDPIGIEYEKSLSPEIFICSYYILEQIHSHPFLSKEIRYQLESLWSDFQTGQIQNYKNRVTTFVHPETTKKIKTPLEKIQDIIDTLVFLLQSVPDHPQTWASVETIRSYFASPADQRQIRQQWAQNISLPAPTAQFVMVGTVLLDSLTNFLTEVKESSQIRKMNWDQIEEEFKTGLFEKTRKILQPLVQNQVNMSEDTILPSSLNDALIITVFNVLYSLLP
jgi:hypothetical protein